MTEQLKPYIPAAEYLAALNEFVATTRQLTLRQIATCSLVEQYLPHAAPAFRRTLAQTFDANAVTLHLAWEDYQTRYPASLRIVSPSTGDKLYVLDLGIDTVTGLFEALAGEPAQPGQLPQPKEQIPLTAGVSFEL